MQIHPDDALGEQMIRNLEVPAYTHVFARIIMNFVLHIT
jgi:hypothetical protein